MRLRTDPFVPLPYPELGDKLATVTEISGVRSDDGFPFGGMVIVVDLGDGVFGVIMNLTIPGRLWEFKPTILAMAGALTYSAPGP